MAGCTGKGTTPAAMASLRAIDSFCLLTSGGSSGVVSAVMASLTAPSGGRGLLPTVGASCVTALDSGPAAGSTIATGAAPPEGAAGAPGGPPAGAGDDPGGVVASLR